MGGQGGNLPVEITGFSRGGGGAVALTNALTRSGVLGTSISLNLVDPYMGPASNIVNDSGVRISLSRSVGFHWGNLALNVGAGMADFTRELYQRSARTGIPREILPTRFNLPHTQMDNLWPSGAVMP
jgi:hypothetical protein